MSDRNLAAVWVILGILMGSGVGIIYSNLYYVQPTRVKLAETRVELVESQHIILEHEEQALNVSVISGDTYSVIIHTEGGDFTRIFNDSVEAIKSALEVTTIDHINAPGIAFWVQEGHVFVIDYNHFYLGCSGILKNTHIIVLGNKHIKDSVVTGNTFTGNGTVYIESPGYFTRNVFDDGVTCVIGGFNGTIITGENSYWVVKYLTVGSYCDQLASGLEPNTVRNGLYYVYKGDL